MTLYLWHSVEMERAAQERGKQPSPGGAFGRSSARGKQGFCIYLDDDGDPVRITSVGNEDTPPTMHKDNRLVGVAENAVCLVGNTGYFSDEAKDWCVQHEIEPSLNGLLAYMGNGVPMRTHTKKPVSVGKPLKLRVGG